MAEKDGKKVGHVYQITYDLGNGRQFSVNGNFLEGSSENDMYDEASKCMNVAERIRARSEVELLQTELRTREKYLERAKEDLRQIRSKEKKNPNDENQITSLVASIKKIEEDVKEGRQNILAASAKANGSAMVSGSGAVN